MSNLHVDVLLVRVVEEIDGLPLAAVQLVGGLVAMSEDLPPWLKYVIMEKLGGRTDMSEVSPAAEAVMRMDAFSKYADESFARLEIDRQLALLKAVALDDKILIAASFMHRLAALVMDAFNDGSIASPDVASATTADQSPSMKREGQGQSASPRHSQYSLSSRSD